MGMRAQFVIPVLASILVLGGLGLTQEAFATTFTISDTTTGGDCVALGGSWNNIQKICTITNLTVSSSDILVIDGVFFFILDTVFNSGTIQVNGGSTIQSGAIIIFDSASLVNNGFIQVNGGSGFSSGIIFNGGLLDNNNIIEINGGPFPGGNGILEGSGTVSNSGTITVNGSVESFSGLILLFNGIFLNECGGVLVLNGGTGQESGFMRVESDFVLTPFTNFGIIDLNGNDGFRSGSIIWFSFLPLLNHGIINSNPGSGDQSGVFVSAGGSIIIEEPPQCPLAKLNELISEIDGFELSKPSEKSLTQKLNAAIKFLTDKNEKNDLNSCNKLNDFVNQVNAQDGKGLTTPQADSLRDSAQEIKNSIGCT